MKASIEPGLQAAFSLRQINARHTNLRESQLRAQGAQFVQEFLRIQRIQFGVHSPIVKTSEMLWPDEQATSQLAAQWAGRSAIRNALIELHGDLGAGKTTFVRHLLRALGVQGRIKSPSYAVVEPYQVGADRNSLSIWHFDFYRFADPREFEDAGFRDLLASPGLKLIEWPEKAQGVLPTPDVALHLSAQSDDSRWVTLQAYSPAGQELLA
jgi:tRNA threonylcarbamoyladenosine biosynthesis protein TsaE